MFSHAQAESLLPLLKMIQNRELPGMRRPSRPVWHWAVLSGVGLAGVAIGALLLRNWRWSEPRPPARAPELERWANEGGAIAASAAAVIAQKG